MKRIDAVQLDALLQGAKTIEEDGLGIKVARCLLYTSPSPRDRQKSRMPSSA